ncbi:MAG: hydrogen gas-evolving membrane-bound hydrogenase subunit E [Thermoplasmata archaeon]
MGSLLVPLDYSREGDGSYEYYVDNWEEVGAANLVAAVLMDWRAYDTMGEAIILFTSIFGFYVLLGGDKDGDVDGG